jgi:hypothetical protein
MGSAQEVKKHADILRLLYKAKPKVRAQLLARASRKLTSVLCSIAKNTLCGVIKLNEKEKKSLIKHKEQLRKIVKRGDNWQRKKLLFLEGGGALLSALLGPFLAIISSTLASKI